MSGGKLLVVIAALFMVFSVRSQCTHTIKLTDTFCDGWNGGTVSVSVNGATVLTEISLASGCGPANFNFNASAGQTIRVWRVAAGSWPGEMRVQIVNSIGTILLNTIQPVTGSATTGGQTCLANCPPPTCPSLTAPANAATNVALAPTLSWTAGTNTSNYDVYLSTNQTLVNNQDVSVRVSLNQVGTTYSASGLNASTTYYWRVVPKNSSGTAATGCSTFSFTTSAPSPTLSNGVLNTFGNLCVNSAPGVNSFTVSGVYLNGSVTVNALSGYDYSLSSGGPFTSTLSIPESFNPKPCSSPNC